MSSSIPRKLSSIVLAFLIALGLNIVPGAIGAQAATPPSVVTTGLLMKNAPGLKWNAEPDFVDTNMISLSASSSGQLGDLLITNFSVDITVGKITTNYKLDNLDLYFDDSNDSPYQIYWSNDTGSPLAGVADFTLVTKIALKGVVNVRSSMSDVFKTALAAKGLTINNFYIYGNVNWGSSIIVMGKNATSKAISLAASKVTFDGVSLSVPSPNLYAGAGEDFYWEIGFSDLDLSINRVSKDLKATLTALTPSTLNTSAVVVPKSLEVGSTSVVADWYYSGVSLYGGPKYSQRTHVCLKIKNTTTKPISVSAQINWTAGTTVQKSTGVQIETLDAGETKCLSGDYDTALQPAGDWRYGKSIKATGSVTVVTATKLALDKIVLLKDYSIDAAESFIAYDADKKTSTVYVRVIAPKDYYGDVMLVGAKIDGKTTVNPVGTSPQSGGGDGPQVNARVLRLGPLAGDLRATSKTITITGSLLATASSNVDSWSQYKGEALGGALYCFPNYQTEWDYDSVAKQTTVEFYCNNITKVDHVVDLLSLKAKVTSKAGTSSTFNVFNKGASSVAIKSRNGAVYVSVFKLPGDLRTAGAQVAFIGQMTVTK